MTFPSTEAATNLRRFIYASKFANFSFDDMKFLVVSVGSNFAKYLIKASRRKSLPSKKKAKTVFYNENNRSIDRQLFNVQVLQFVTISPY